MTIFIVFDVESLGLHGEGWQVGYVVVGEDGQEFEHGSFECQPGEAAGFGNQGQIAEDRAWVAEHCRPHVHLFDCKNPAEVRAKFWARWLHWKEQGARLAADVCWPVETGFLTACIQDHGDPWAGPYPLIDIASVRLAVGLDPLATVERLPNELPAHNALADARQSARLLLEALVLGRPRRWCDTPCRFAAPLGQGRACHRYRLEPATSPDLIGQIQAWISTLDGIVATPSLILNDCPGFEPVGPL